MNYFFFAKDLAVDHAKNLGVALSPEETHGVALSPAEQEIAGTKLMPFCVTVAQAGSEPDQLRVLAPSCVDAVTMALEIMFPDFDTMKPAGSLSIKAEPLKPAILVRRAA